ncbi:glycosyl hydrolase 115 family protein [Spirillospora sp. CA-142024]|uniref:glycosyl hydrolase 115 family protein n=1 Tax=Spirillospora sp. CA-142024 TaxID=3240036 RepID=UPI003D8B5D15
MGGSPRMWKVLLTLVPTVVAFTAAPAAARAPARPGQGQDPASYISFRDGRGYFPLVEEGKAAPLVVSAADHAGVVRVVGDLRSDIERVTGVKPAVARDGAPSGQDVVIVGTIGQSPLIDRLVKSGKLDVKGIAGKWETTLEQVVDHPMPGVRRAFVIAGSDQRGTIYGAYDVSKNIGVSPWYWWDDVPSRHRGAVYVKPGRHTQGTPAVKYRGFFINDENPALGRWAPKQFGPGKAAGHPGGFNAGFYARVFETMLRLKANYLWPAVWGRAFAEDDPQNHATAKRYGVVMGTSHEAPMMRGIEEWNRHAMPGHDPYGGTGEWSYRRNAEAIEKYWKDGIERMVREDFEGVVTLGMRGNGDTSLPDGDGIELMQNIIANERRILGDATGKDPSATPQVWTLYKEVQRYWDRGLRVPDDVTVVFTDDNGGNMRKMPDRNLPERAGGYGLYYHFDYVGGGRNYKWVDTAQLGNTWEQLNQSYQYGIRNLWVANVGDMKNNELPLQFFLDYAWDPGRWPLSRLKEWERRYAAQSFGSEHAAEIADVLDGYGNLQALRKPELLNRRITVDPGKDLPTDSGAVVYDDQQTPFYLNQYREMDGVTARWKQLAADAERIGRRLPAAYRDAYYQLVYYQVKATANLYELRDAEFTNILYAKQGRAATNDYADLAEARFADDQAMSNHYNTRLAGGKWDGFQTQPHIGYGDVERYGPNAPWQQPELNNEALPDEIFPKLKRIDVPDGSDMGVAIDGSDEWWPEAKSEAVLPEFSPYQSAPAQYIEVFNRGSEPFGYRISPAQPWVKVSRAHGRVDKQIRATVSIDWSRAPKGTSRVPIEISGPNGRTVTVQAVVKNPASSNVHGFVEAGGYVSMNADHYTRATGTAQAQWNRIPGIGRTDAGMEPSPVTASSLEPGTGPRLEYDMTLTTTGPVKVWAYLSPRNSVLSTEGLRYAVSIDGEQPQLVNVTTATGANDTTMNKQWERNTSDNVNRTVTTHTITGTGTHTLKFWMVDPTVIVQKIVVDTGGLRTSYLGPPESTLAYWDVLTSSPS